MLWELFHYSTVVGDTGKFYKSLILCACFLASTLRDISLKPETFRHFRHASNFDLIACDL